MNAIRASDVAPSPSRAGLFGGLALGGSAWFQGGRTRTPWPTGKGFGNPSWC
jgi:hypothetical protein